MFNILKNLKELRELNNLVSSESVVVEKDGVKVKINGKMEVEEIVLNSSLDLNKQQKILKDCFNEAIKKIQFNLVQKISNMKKI